MKSFFASKENENSFDIFTAQIVHHCLVKEIEYNSVFPIHLNIVNTLYSF